MDNAVIGRMLGGKLQDGLDMHKIASRETFVDGEKALWRRGQDRVLRTVVL